MDGLRVIVFGVQPYSFEDRESGRKVEGISVFYSSGSQNDEYGIGHVPKKVTVKIDMLPKFKHMQFPHLCDAELGHQLTSKGIKTTVSDFKSLNKTVDLDKLLLS